MCNVIYMMDPGAVPGISTYGGDLVSTNVTKIAFYSLWYLRTRPLKIKANANRGELGNVKGKSKRVIGGTSQYSFSDLTAFAGA